MSGLGDVLELLHGAGRSFGTVRVEAREWRHNHRLLAAYDRAMERARGAALVVSRLAGADDVPAETEVLVRAWFEQPNRVREERDDAGSRYVAVADGARWWQRMPGWATMSEEGDGWASGQIGHSVRPLLDPWQLVGALELNAIGRTTVRGPRGVRPRGGHAREPARRCRGAARPRRRPPRARGRRGAGRAAAGRVPPRRRAFQRRRGAGDRVRRAVRRLRVPLRARAR